MPSIFDSESGSNNAINDVVRIIGLGCFWIEAKSSENRQWRMITKMQRKEHKSHGLWQAPSSSSSSSLYVDDSFGFLSDSLLLHLLDLLSSPSSSILLRLSANCCRGSYSRILLCDSLFCSVFFLLFYNSLVSSFVLLLTVCWGFFEWFYRTGSLKIFGI